MLIAAGSDVNEIHVSEHLADFYISSPLMYACEQGNFDVAKELSALGADVNAVLFEGEFGDPYNSPLILASTHGHIDIVKFTLAHKDFKAVETISYALVEACENEHCWMIIPGFMNYNNRNDIDKRKQYLYNEKRGRKPTVKLSLTYNISYKLNMQYTYL